MEDDLESPGYEYLRSYENMITLHEKLLVLNYEREFCLAYKCSPIHRFYFSLPSNNPGEQRFLFTCLCAWLIKAKCHMNLEIEPEEYEDLDVTLSVVIEALRLIMSDEMKNEETKQPKGGNKRRNSTGYLNQSKLRRGYGPEVIWTLNILADRALEILLDDGSGRDGAPAEHKLKIRVAYKQSPAQEERGPSTLSSITVGQPIVGGGLTTRPLGNYIIDDRSLLLDDDDTDGDEAFIQREDPADSSSWLGHNDAPDVEPHEWYSRVESSRHILESVRFEAGQSGRLEDWTDEIGRLDEAQKCVDSFLDKSRPFLESSARLVDSQLQLIGDRQMYLQTQLRGKLDDFLEIWRSYSSELARNKELQKQVDSRTDKFESLDNRLQAVQSRIEARKRDLNDGSELDELRLMTKRLVEENKEYDTRIGLLLAVHFKLDST